MLGVDLHHVEDAVRHILRSQSASPSLLLVDNSTLLLSSYIDSVVAAVSASLAQTGLLSLTAQAQHHQLPALFLRAQLLQRRLSSSSSSLPPFTLQDGQDDLYTAEYVQRHLARLRGALAGLTRPTTVRSLLALHSFLPSLLYSQTAQLVQAGEVLGSVSGSDDRSLFTPLLYVRAQDDGVASFFLSSGCISLSVLQSMAIAQPLSYLRNRWPDGIALDSVFVSAETLRTAVDVMEEAAQAQGWAGVAAIAPSGLTLRDQQMLCQQAVKAVNAEQERLLLMGDVYAVAAPLLQELKDRLVPVVQQLAVELLVQQQQQAMQRQARASQQQAAGKGERSEEARDASDGEEEDDDGDDEFEGDADRKRAASAVSREEEKRQKREEKKKQKRAAKKTPAARAAGSGPAAKAQQGRAAASSSLSAPSLTRAVVQRLVRERWKGDEPPGELLTAIASHLFPSLLSDFNASIDRAKIAPPDAETAGDEKPKAVFTPLARRARHELIAAALQEAFEHISVFSDAIASLPEGGEGRLQPEQEEELRSLLSSHLLKTLCSGAFDSLLRFEAAVHQLQLPTDGKEEKESIVSLTRPLTAKDRESVLQRLPASSLQSLRPVEAALNSSVAAFLSAFDLACAASDIRLLRPDKKKAKLLVFHMRRALQTQLTQQTQLPHAACLLLAAIVLHSKLTAALLHAPSKALPLLLDSIRAGVKQQAWATLMEYRESIGRLKAAEEGGDGEAVRQKLDTLREAVRSMGLEPGTALIAAEGKAEDRRDEARTTAPRAAAAAHAESTSAPPRAKVRKR